MRARKLYWVLRITITVVACLAQSRPDQLQRWVTRFVPIRTLACCCRIGQHPSLPGMVRAWVTGMIGSIFSMLRVIHLPGTLCYCDRVVTDSCVAIQGRSEVHALELFRKAHGARGVMQI
ncbi:hypothetical protein C8Q70DRAFT_957232 [Cubamyces menziesii]|nr:hypothetical protein C8Q70DRAFT_957232 [Cubamyces menziesii]